MGFTCINECAPGTAAQPTETYFHTWVVRRRQWHVNGEGPADFHPNLYRDLSHFSLLPLVILSPFFPTLQQHLSVFRVNVMSYSQRLKVSFGNKLAVTKGSRKKYEVGG